MAVMTEPGADAQRETRWSANKKTDAVLRLLRGEKLDVLSRELGVEAHRLAAWRDEFLAAGKDGLKGASQVQPLRRPGHGHPGRRSPSSTGTACSTDGVIDAIEETTAAATGLRSDAAADQYIYN